MAVIFVMPRGIVNMILKNFEKLSLEVLEPLSRLLLWPNATPISSLLCTFVKEKITSKLNFFIVRG